MRKIKLLCVCSSLGLGGSERCMTEMLRNMDQERYEITVQSLIPVKNMNVFPEYVRVINGYEGFEECNEPMREFIPKAVKAGQFRKLARKSIYWYQVTYGKKDYTAEFWKAFAAYIPNLHEQYDVTIGYGPGLASLFAIEKVPNGGKKILWVNTNLVRSGFDLKYQKKAYMQADRIVTVCRNLLRDMQGYYPEFAHKMSVFYDMLDIPGIRRLGDAYLAQYERTETPRILTVGRICEAKALHLVAEAAAILKEKQIDFLWYIVGDGELRTQLESRIQALHVQDRVVLLGALDNPYPWFKDCNVYVQTSVYEGSCTTITEALIFGKPVVTTDIDIAYEKIDDGRNGLVCGMSGMDIAEKVERLLLNPQKIDEMSMYINANPIFYGDQIEAFDELIDALIYE